MDRVCRSKDHTIFSLDASSTKRNATSIATGRCEPLTRDLCCTLQAEWENLAAAASLRNIFQFPSFVRNSLPLLCEHDPKIVTIRSEGLLIGIVILRRDIGYAKLPVSFWRSALHHEQYLGEPLVRAGFEDQFAAGLCTWLDHAPRDCCFLNLSMVSTDGPLAKAMERQCANDGRKILTANHFERAAILPVQHDGMQAKDLLRPSRRKSIKRAMTSLSKQGEVSLERLTDPAQLRDWTTQFLAMENTGWKHENGSSILCCEKETALYEAMIGEAFEAGNLHFSRLCLNRKPIAFTLDIAAAPVGYCLKSAIDQEYRKLSPGVLMEFETLKYYLGNKECLLLDSCSAPENALLNEMWPDRKAIMDLAIARKGLVYGVIFQGMYTIKSLLKTATGN